MSKYFLLAFICLSLAQVQGGEVENAKKKGLLKVKDLYGRGMKHINGVNGYENRIIQTQSAAFAEKIRRMQESSRQILRRVAQESETKAKEMQKPESVFKCITEAENNANNQIQAITTKFRSDVERMKQTYSTQLQTASRPLETMKQEFESKYRKTVEEIKACKSAECVENVVRNFSNYFERFSEDVREILDEIITIVSNFQKEVRATFNNTSRQMGAVKSEGLRRIRECVYKNC